LDRDDHGTETAVEKNVFIYNSEDPGLGSGDICSPRTKSLWTTTSKMVRGIDMPFDPSNGIKELCKVAFAVKGWNASSVDKAFEERP
jgi:hypothetical protein